MPPSSQSFGLLAEFTTAADILRAAEMVRDAGFQRWDVFTPFPVHGMDRAMCLPNSKVGRVAFCGGAAGFVIGMATVWFLNAVDYPILVGGKPMFSPFSALPTAFELTILLSAFGAVLGMLFFNRLPRLYHPLLKHRTFALASHDRFFLVIETADPKYSDPEIRRLLAAAGSERIELVEP